MDEALENIASLMNNTTGDTEGNKYDDHKSDVSVNTLTSMLKPNLG